MRAGVQRAQSLAKLLARIASECTRDRRRLVLWVSGVSLSGAVARGGVIAFLAKYINWMAEGHDFRYGSVHFQVGQNLPSLLVLAAVVGAVLLYSAWAQYESQARARAIARAFLERTCAEDLELYARSQRLGTTQHPLTAQRLQLNTVRNARHLSNAAESLIHGLPPACNAMVATAIALWLSPLLTTAVMALGLVAVPLIYRLSALIQRNAASFYNDKAFGMSHFVRDLIADIDHASAPIGGQCDYAEEMRRNPKSTEFMQALDLNMLATDRMVLMAGVLKASFLALALVLFGYLYISGERSPGEIIAYVVALNAMFNAYQALSGILANLIRFHPQIAEHYRIQQSLLDELQRAGFAAAARPERIELRSPSGDAERLEPGRPTLYIHPDRLARSTLPSLLGPLESASSAQAWTNVAVCAMNPNRLTAGLRRAMGAMPPAELEQRLEAVGADDELALLRAAAPDERAACIEGELPAARAIAVVDAIRDNPAPVLLLDGALLRRIDAAQVERILEPLADRIVLVTAHRAGQVPVGIERAIIASHQGVTGTGDRAWLADQDLRWLESAGAGGGVLDDDLLMG